MANNDVEERFNEFWEAYPHKRGKGAARGAYYRAMRKAQPEALLAALKAQIAAGFFSCEPEFRPHPRTWLHQERWEDELTAKRVASAAEGLAERFRDASKRGDDRGKAQIKADAAQRGVAWADVAAALAKLNGGAA